MGSTKLSADVLHIHHGQSVDLGLLTPIAEPVEPRQEFRFAGPTTPEKRFALALIDDARTELRYRSRALVACWWFFYEESERPMSFAWCATALGLDVDYVRRGIRDELRALHQSVPTVNECVAAAEAEVQNRHATPRTGGPRVRHRYPRELPPPITAEERNRSIGRSRCARGHRRPPGTRCKSCMNIALERWRRKQADRSSAPESAGQSRCHPVRAGNGAVAEERS